MRVNRWWIGLLLAVVTVLTSCRYAEPDYSGWNLTREQRDSLEFRATHHYGVNYNFQVLADSLPLRQMLSADSLWLYRGDVLVVADYAVMTSELMASAERATDAAACELRAPDAVRGRVRKRLVREASNLVASIRGEAVGVSVDEVEACLASGHAAEGASCEKVLLARAAAHFLNEAENGVPVELAFGRGSLARLRQAALACAPVPEQ